jgi:PAS domain S-box-containing protein
MPFETPFHTQLADARARVADLRRSVDASGRGGDPVLARALDELALALEELQVGDEELHAQNESLAAAELLLATERQRYADLFHFAPEPYLVTGADGTIREINHAAAELLQVRARNLVGKPLTVFVAREEVRRFREQVNRAAAGVRVRDYEVTLARRGGETACVSCTIQPSARPIPGGPALWWLLRDVTGRRRLEDAERRLAAEQAARAEAEAGWRRLESVLEATSDAFFRLDAEWRLTYVNARAERFWNLPRAALLGRVVQDVFPTIAGSEAEAVMSRVMEQRRPIRREVFSPVVRRWIEMHAFPTDDGLSVFFHDIENRHRREAGERLLADAGEALAGSLEMDEMLRRLAETAAGPFAAWAVAHLAAGPSAAVCGVAHAQGSLTPALAELLRAAPVEGRHPVALALASGEAALLAGSDEVLADAFPLEAQRRQAREMGAASAIVAPLQARGRTVGALTFVRGPGAPAYEPADVELAMELARRAALAVDNARLYAEARAATRAREEVLAVVSHDLRNPLNAILLASIVLDEYGDPGRWTERERQQIRAIRNSADQMTALIHDLVEVVALESGTRVMHLDRVEPAKAMRAAAEMYHGLAAEKGIALAVDVAADVPDVRADRARVLQVLSNLVGNALKFTPRDGQVTLGAHRAGDGSVGFYVADTGPGIPAEHVPRLFDRFWQAQRGDRKGLGLGLAIAKGIVEAHGGRIWAETAPGRGSTFFFTLPAFTGD